MATETELSEMEQAELQMTELEEIESLEMTIQDRIIIGAIIQVVVTSLLSS